MIDSLPIPTVSEQARERNLRRDPENPARCAVCGLPTDGTRLIHTILGSDVIAADTPDEQIPAGEDSGWFAIGPECAKRLPATHVRRSQA